MTGAGAGTVAFAIEDSFGTLPDLPTWIQPGEILSVGSVSLERALERARAPDDPRPKGSRPGNRETAISLSTAIAGTDFHDLVFANGGTSLATSASRAPTATWYFGADTLDGSEDRFIQGCPVESWSLQYNQGETNIPNDFTIIGASEIDADDANAPDVPSSIQQPAKDDVATAASVEFTLNGSQLSALLQSFSIDVSGMARFRRGQQQEPVDAVVGAYEPSFSITAVLEDGTQRELAYGSSGATIPTDTVDSSTGTVTIESHDGTALATYTLSDLQPNTYDWTDLVNGDTDITEPVEYHATDVSA